MLEYTTAGQEDPKKLLNIYHSQTIVTFHVMIYSHACFNRI